MARIGNDFGFAADDTIIIGTTLQLHFELTTTNRDVSEALVLATGRTVRWALATKAAPTVAVIDVDLSSGVTVDDDDPATVSVTIEPTGWPNGITAGDYVYQLWVKAATVGPTLAAEGRMRLRSAIV